MSQSLDGLKLDCEEVKRLLGFATRQRVKDLLVIEQKKLEMKISKEEDIKASAVAMETDGAAGGGDASVRMKTDIKSSHVYTVKITSYGWDQSDKFMKLYITLKGIETLPKDNCLVQFGEESVTICVSNLNGKNHELIIKTLLNPIIPSDSHFKIKTDMLVVFMKKKDKQTWAYVTKGDMKNKEKKPPKMDNADPSAGIMNMMKNMYEEGDDDMKRTIAKAWTESRDKQMNPDIGDMGM